jgi:DNA-binding response OmpR family regulator
MSGIDVLRVMRADVRWATLPCIVLTAAGQDAQLRETEALGVSEIMTKPFSPRRLLSRVQAYTAPAAALSADPSQC